MKINISVDCDAQRINFSDNGPGVAEPYKDRIFEAFYTTKPEKEGRGLGLFISRRMAESNGFSLTLTGPDNDRRYRIFCLEQKRD